MKEEYVEGILESPTVIEETVPEQLKGAFGQAANALQQIPVPIRDAVTSGLKVPLSKLFLIFYMNLWEYPAKPSLRDLHNLLNVIFIGKIMC